MTFNLTKPIGVFDAGIGSYAIAQMIRQHFPKQDILYYADRASFPYGAKSKKALVASVLAATDVLVDLGAVAVVLASNAPSVVVLDGIRDRVRAPILGVYPPVADALARSRSGHVAVIGVWSLVTSPEIQAYVAREAPTGQVELRDGSPLVDLVETGLFLSRPDAAQTAVDAFMADLIRNAPKVDVCTLSSTHLPWLRPFFHKAAPAMLFIDPAETLLPQISQHASPGSGQTVCIASQSDDYPVSQLRQMFATLGVTIEPHLIAAESSQ